MALIADRVDLNSVVSSLVAAMVWRIAISLRVPGLPIPGKAHDCECRNVLAESPGICLSNLCLLSLSINKYVKKIMKGQDWTLCLKNHSVSDGLAKMSQQRLVRLRNTKADQVGTMRFCMLQDLCNGITPIDD